MRTLLLATIMMTVTAVSFAQTNQKVKAQKSTAAKAEINMPVTTMQATSDVSVDAVVAAKEDIAVSEQEYDFGKIPQGTPVTHVFTVKNTSNAAYKLSNVQASCGCTTPVWDREKAIAPNQSEAITVGYNAAAAGPFNKSITISYGENQTKVVYIKGEVWSAPAESAPVNEAVKQID
jgi:hypothetical protein